MKEIRCENFCSSYNTVWQKRDDVRNTSEYLQHVVYVYHLLQDLSVSEDSVTETQDSFKGNSKQIKTTKCYSLLNKNVIGKLALCEWNKTFQDMLL